MKSFFKSFLLGILVLTVFIGLGSISIAATLTVDSGTGKLTGATNVSVNNNLYNVQFIDDSGVNLFYTANDGWSFVFTDFASAAAASNALLDQVFLNGSSGNFDSAPYLTQGINQDRLQNIPDDYAQIYTAYEYAEIEGHEFLKCAMAVNFDDTDRIDTVSSVRQLVHTVSDMSNYDYRVYAVWTQAEAGGNSPVPEPGTIILMGFGLLGMAGAGRKLKKQ